MIVGMDFGTTNSGIAVHDGSRVKLLPLDPSSSNPAIARTALYITNDHQITIGREAVDSYFDQNVGRPVKIKKVWVGEVEVYGADMYYVADVFAWVDILSPGRLFLSIKSGLSDPDYQGTMVGQFYYSLETLIASYMSLSKIRAEKILGQEITGVVLGRPVRFSEDPEADRLAEARLLEAAAVAGYKDVFLQYEPIAAAYHYAAAIDRSQNILVFDFGGGTLDITVMALNRAGQHQVLSTSGIPVAGDVFDQKLVRAKLPKHFAEGSRYQSPAGWLPLPAWIYDIFSNWQTIIELQTPSNRRLLNEIAQTAEDRKGIEGLISLVSNNYSLQMFDTIEMAKRQLSDKMGTIIRLQGPRFNVSEPLSRTEFEQLIVTETQKIADHIDETMLSAGLNANQIDAVIRTGGSSEIPVFKVMLMTKFGADKVHKIGTFSSVASGLGIMAYQISRGEIQADASKSELASLGFKSGSKHDVSAINMDFLKLRMTTSETSGRAAGDSLSVLTFLTSNGRLSVLPWNETEMEQELPADILKYTADGLAVRSALLTKRDQKILLATNRFRFLLTSPNDLIQLAQVGLSISDFYQLMGEEVITAAVSWNQFRDCSKLILVTSQGFARGYAMAQMAENIEGPATFMFDQPLPGSPAAILGSDGTDFLLSFSDRGRASRFLAARLRTQGQTIIKLGTGERLLRAMTAMEEDELLLMTKSGYGRRLQAGWIPGSEDGKSSGRSIISRPGLCGIESIETGEPIWTITDEAIMALDTTEILPGGQRSKKSQLLLKSSDRFSVSGLVSNQIKS